MSTCQKPFQCKENRRRCICALTRLSPVFKNLSQDELHKITEISAIRIFHKGEIVFLENQVCDYLYILLSGKIKVYKSNDVRELILRILEPPMIFAEAPVFDVVPYYNASASVLEEAELLLINKDGFQKMALQNEILVKNLFELFSSRVRGLDNQIAEMNLKSVESRLANYILELKPSHKINEIKLPISKTDLARSLGTISETLSRAFKNLSKQELIISKNNSITVLDYEKLEVLAQG